MLELCPKVAVILDFLSTKKTKKQKKPNMIHLEVNIKSIPTE
jgi:hypothetical protein